VWEQDGRVDEWREPEEIAADLTSGDSERVRAGLAALLAYTRHGDEMDLPALEPWLLDEVGEVPAETVTEFARLLASYRSFTPPPSRAHRLRQLVELSLRYRIGQVIYETSIELQGQPDPVAAARDTVDHLRARGLHTDREIGAAADLLHHLMWAKAPVRRAAVTALAGWPDSPARRALVATVLPVCEPDQRPLLQAPPGPGAPLPPVSFDDTAIDRTERYSIGVERRTGRCYVSIPATNGLVDYEEYFEIDPATYAHFTATPAAALPFVRRCRARQEDPRLLYQPSLRRGSAT
jgi:hypothetical protein